MNTYFKSNGKLIAATVDTTNVEVALIETLTLAANEKMKPDGAILAYLEGGKK